MKGVKNKPKVTKLPDRSILLRLNDQRTLTSLDSIQKHYNKSQASKAIVEVLNSYMSLKEELQELRQKHNELSRKYSNLVDAVERKIDADNHLKSLFTDNSNKLVGFDDDDDDNEWN